jgi:hypothetical protein
MTEGIPRYVIALAALVALVVISISVKDYIEDKNAKPSASTSVPATAAPDAATVTKKKTSSGKPRRALETRTSTTKASGSVKAQTTASNMEKLPANANPPNAGISQAAEREAEAEDSNNRVRHELNTKIARPPLSAPQCVPLPNVTNSRDVDAPYYQNWAREYSCLI